MHKSKKRLGLAGEGRRAVYSSEVNTASRARDGFGHPPDDM
jgi:hypothetical protein